MAVVISGTGLYTPTQSISNDELVHCFNQYVEKFNLTHSQEIENGEIDALSPSDSSFIEKASGIKSRYVMEKESILNVDIMSPRYSERDNDQLSMQAEIGVAAAKEAMLAANKTPEDIDLIIGGHTHTFLDEPTIETNAAGKEVLVNQVGCYGLYMGKIDFYFEANELKESVGSKLAV